MMLSMTGFGKATGDFKNKRIRVELKSLNSKNLDLYVRMPNLYKEKEIDLRKIIGESLKRGKIECNIYVDADSESKAGALNKAAIKGYYEDLRELKDELGVESSEVLSSVLRLPDAFTTPTEELDEEEWNYVTVLTEEALKKINNFRREEGEGLTKEFNQRISQIEKLLLEIPEFEEERIAEIRNRIEQNLDAFSGSAKVDKNRFEQELIYYIEKIDIAEEKQRLSKHLNYFLETMSSAESNGKKLGFIGQEIGREINTLGSKAYHTEMQKRVVQMKDELEKIKEQVLNTL